MEAGANSYIVRKGWLLYWDVLKISNMQFIQTSYLINAESERIAGLTLCINLTIIIEYKNQSTDKYLNNSHVVVVCVLWP